MEYSQKPKRKVTNFHPDGSEFSPKNVALNRETPNAENAVKLLEKAFAGRVREKLTK